MTSLPRWPLTPVLLVWSLAAAPFAPAQNGSPDSSFARIPFDEWLKGGDQTRMKWSVRVSHPQLSNHQRLLVEVETLVDGVELAKRRGKGQLVIFVQVTDAQDHRYQNHGVVDLEKLEEGIRAQMISYIHHLFVQPGDYRVAVAILATATGEHSVKQEQLHVVALKNDPLPDAWRDLPPVEFLPPDEPPDSWYLPEVKGRLHLPLTTRHPARVEVLLNLTPSERLSGSQRVQNRNLAALLPALKVISQIEASDAALDIKLLDLSRRRVTFHQEDVRELDWARMRGSFAESDPGIIDVKSLGERHHAAAFFVKEVGRAIERAEAKPARVLIVFSSPVEFESGEELSPIESGEIQDGIVFYIRYHVPVVRPNPVPFQPPYPPVRRGRPNFTPRPQPPAVDQLAATLKPLAPRVFDIDSPEQFRKALATILAETSGL